MVPNDGIILIQQFLIQFRDSLDGRRRIPALAVQLGIALCDALFKLQGIQCIIEENSTNDDAAKNQACQRKHNRLLAVALSKPFDTQHHADNAECCCRYTHDTHDLAKSRSGKAKAVAHIADNAYKQADGDR